jgi:excisionase family DNA binding protein
MRGFGDFQRAQMKKSDPRIAELFRQVRGAIDILEHLALASMAAPEPPKSKVPTVERTPMTIDQTKIAYSVREVSLKIGVSRSHVYNAIASKQLRALKCGSRTQILTEDLQAWIASWPERS